MDYEAVSSLLLSYIEQNRSVSPVRITSTIKKGNGLFYKNISLDYYYRKIDIKIYNQNFIIIKVNNSPKQICDSLKSARQRLDSIISDFY